MDCPHNAIELRIFIGCVTSHAHILKPLTDQSGLKKKAPIQWTDEMQKVFNKMGLLMADNALELIQTTISGSTHTLMPLTSS
jgi:hypothetical protein